MVLLSRQDKIYVQLQSQVKYILFKYLLPCVYHVFFLEGAPAPAKAAPKVEDAQIPTETPVAAAPATQPPPPQQSQPQPPPPSSPRVAAPPATAPQASKQHAATVKLPPADPTKEISGTRSEYRVKMNRMRIRIAERLKDAQNVNAMLTTFNEIDMR